MDAVLDAARAPEVGIEAFPTVALARPMKMLLACLIASASALNLETSLSRGAVFRAAAAAAAAGACRVQTANTE